MLFYNGFKGASFAFDGNSNLKQVWSRMPGRVLKSLWSRFNFPPVETLIGRVDVFHNPFNFNFTHYTPVSSLSRMVVTFNGMTDPSHIWERYDPEKINRWFRIIAKRASTVIAVSESVKDDLLSRVDIPEERIKVIYYGVSEEFRPMHDKTKLESILSRYGLLGKRYVLYVGAAEKNKNLSGLLKAFRIIRKRNGIEDLYLVLVGKIDKAYHRTIKEADDMGIKERVIFTDYIGHDHLPFIYNGAEVFVLPTFHEWFGIPLLESMACGVPVAASNCRGIPEVVGDAAVLFDPYRIEDIAESITTFIENKGFREGLIRKGLERAKLFTWKKTAEETLKVYNTVYEISG